MTPTTLPLALDEARLSWDVNKAYEEQGGFILKKGDGYAFVPITNKFSGTMQAIALYEMLEAEFREKVLMPTLEDTWQMHATFHTHPKGCRPMPSRQDRTGLFKNAASHYIYNPFDDELMRFDYNKQTTNWDASKENENS